MAGKSVGIEKFEIDMTSLQNCVTILNGKWRLRILYSLLCHRQRNFSSIERDVSGISARMLSKELKELETNQLITRRILDSRNVAVQYELTDYGSTLKKVIIALIDWGKIKNRIK